MNLKGLPASRVGPFSFVRGPMQTGRLTPQRCRLTRTGIYQKLDHVTGDVRYWLDEKRLLDAELVAEEGMAWHGAVESGSEETEWLERMCA